MRHFYFIVFYLYGSLLVFGQHISTVDSFVVAQSVKPHLLGDVLRKEGNRNLILGNYNIAQQYYNEALAQFTSYSDSIGIGYVLSNQASLAKRVGNFPLAVEKFYTSLKIFNTAGELKGEIMVCINLAVLYKNQKDFDKAVEYYYRAEELLKNYNDPKRKANVGMGLGNILSLKEHQYYDLDRAREVYLDALSYYSLNNDSISIGKIYNNLGRLHSESGKLNEALISYKISLKIKENFGDKAGQVIANLNIGSILKKQKKYNESLKYFNKGEKLAIELGDARGHLHILSNLVDITVALNRVDSMTIYLDNYKTLKDSVFNEEKQRQLSELQTLYETEQKEKALITEQKRNQIKTTQNRRLISLTLALFVAIGVIVVVNNKHRNTLKKNAQKESEIATLNAHITGQEKERERIATDLHDQIGAILNNVKMMHSKYAHEGGDLGAKVEAGLVSTSNIIREVSHNLSSATLKRYGLVIATEQLFVSLNATNKIQAKLITKGMSNRLHEQVERVIDFCVHELVNNTLKYANASQIDLQYLVDDKNLLHVIYEDDGVGFDASSIDYGIGLKSIEARVASVNGKMAITTAPSKGLMIVIEVFR